MNCRVHSYRWRFKYRNVHTENNGISNSPTVVEWNFLKQQKYQNSGVQLLSSQTTILPAVNISKTPNLKYMYSSNTHKSHRLAITTLQLSANIYTSTSLVLTNQWRAAVSLAAAPTHTPTTEWKNSPPEMHFTRQRQTKYDFHTAMSCTHVHVLMRHVEERERVGL